MAQDITATVGQKNNTTANINVNTGDGPEVVSVDSDDFKSLLKGYFLSNLCASISC